MPRRPFTGRKKPEAPKKCPPGEILKSGYHTVRGGRRIFVPPTCIVDRGAPGKTPKAKQWFDVEAGTLRGWTKDMPEDARHRLLTKIARDESYSTVVKRLVAIANVTTDSETERKMRADADWLKANRERLDLEARESRRSIGPRQLPWVDGVPTGPAGEAQFQFEVDEIEGYVIRAENAANDKKEMFTNVQAFERLMRSGMPPEEMARLKSERPDLWERIETLRTAYDASGGRKVPRLEHTVEIEGVTLEVPDTISHVADAVARYQQEGDRGAEWTFHMGMTQADRDEFDRFLVRANHPLALKPSTQEARFVEFVRLSAKSPLQDRHFRPWEARTAEAWDRMSVDQRYWWLTRSGYFQDEPGKRQRTARLTYGELPQLLKEDAIEDWRGSQLKARKNASDRPIRPPRTEPKEGDKVFTYFGGFGGSRAVAEGIVVRKGEELKVQIESTSSLLGGQQARKKTVVMDKNWTKTTEEHPWDTADHVSRERAAKRDAEWQAAMKAKQDQIDAAVAAAKTTGVPTFEISNPTVGQRVVYIRENKGGTVVEMTDWGPIVRLDGEAGGGITLGKNWRREIIGAGGVAPAGASFRQP